MGLGDGEEDEGKSFYGNGELTKGSYDPTETIYYNYHYLVEYSWQRSNCFY